MIFVCKPDYADYEMVCEIAVSADSEEEAIDIAEKQAEEVNAYLLIERPQKWSVTPIEKNFKGTLSFGINW